MASLKIICLIWFVGIFSPSATETVRGRERKSVVGVCWNIGSIWTLFWNPTPQEIDIDHDDHLLTLWLRGAQKQDLPRRLLVEQRWHRCLLVLLWTTALCVSFKDESDNTLHVSNFHQNQWKDHNELPLLSIVIIYAPFILFVCIKELLNTHKWASLLPLGDTFPRYNDYGHWSSFVYLTYTAPQMP